MEMEVKEKQAPVRKTKLNNNGANNSATFVAF